MVHRYIDMKTTNMIKSALIAAVLLIAGCGGTSSSKPTTGTITGFALLRGSATSKDILVYLNGSPSIVYTDAAGDYSLTDIPVGAYTLYAAKQGYASASQNIDVAGGQTVRALPMSLTLIATSFSITAPLTTVEDQPFPLMITALVNGSITPTYDGPLQASASWGDITPTTVTGFLMGTATLPATLNREGAVAVTFSDATSPWATAAMGINVLPISWRIIGATITASTVIPLGSPGSWDSTQVQFPSVVNTGGRLSMLYSGYDGAKWQIGAAYSTNGSTWTKTTVSKPAIPVTSSTFYSHDALGASLMYDNGIYKAWLSGDTDGTWATRKIGYGTSANGITWSVEPQPVMSAGTSGFDMSGVSLPSVIEDNGVYKMWFTGYDGSKYRIGYATSSDGVTWTKYSQGGTDVAVLDVTSSGYDASGVVAPSVVKDMSLYKMYYTGMNGTSLTLDLAVSTDGINWVKSPSNPKLGNISYSTGVRTPDFFLSGMYLYFTYLYNGGASAQIAAATYP